MTADMAKKMEMDHVGAKPIINLNQPYGGELVSLLVSEENQVQTKKDANRLREIPLDDLLQYDLEMLANGSFSPLIGFMTKEDYLSVLDIMRLVNGTLWPIPVCLDVDSTTADSLEIGSDIALTDLEGFQLAILKVESVWEINKIAEAEAVYGTTDTTHPGVQRLFFERKTHYVGGRITVISLPLRHDFTHLRNTPLQLRQKLESKGWTNVVTFQTRHPIHRPQYEMTLRVMKDTGAKLLIQPVVGVTHSQDFDHYTRVRCYNHILNRYPEDSVDLNLLPYTMRFAGPREVIIHAIVAKNCGCSHIIVGHGHATPGVGQNSLPFYRNDGAKELSIIHQEEIGINIIPYREMRYLYFEEEYRFADEIPEETQSLNLSCNNLRKRIREGRTIPDWITFPEVLDELRTTCPPPHKQGFTIFLTGLPGAGKSTLARLLYAKFREMIDRPVTLLDGDIVRRNLSSELTFSKEHRDLNVRRIGFVANEITKNGGIAICAPIAPYAQTRYEIRKLIEQSGGFFEVHVATPQIICEQRDRKGMYAKAKAGIISGFTGVDDPYEIPDIPACRIDTSKYLAIDACKIILEKLQKEKYIQ